MDRIREIQVRSEFLHAAKRLDRDTLYLLGAFQKMRGVACSYALDGGNTSEMVDAEFERAMAEKR